MDELLDLRSQLGARLLEDGNIAGRIRNKLKYMKLRVTRASTAIASGSRSCGSC
jgi:hypothetical protein